MLALGNDDTALTDHGELLDFGGELLKRSGMERAPCFTKRSACQSGNKKSSPSKVGWTSKMADALQATIDLANAHGAGYARRQLAKQLGAPAGPPGLGPEEGDPGLTKLELKRQS